MVNLLRSRGSTLTIIKFNFRMTERVNCTKLWHKWQSNSKLTRRLQSFCQIIGKSRNCLIRVSTRLKNFLTELTARTTIKCASQPVTLRKVRRKSVAFCSTPRLKLLKKSPTLEKVQISSAPASLQTKVQLQNRARTIPCLDILFKS